MESRLLLEKMSRDDVLEALLPKEHSPLFAAHASEH